MLKARSSSPLISVPEVVNDIARIFEKIGTTTTTVDECENNLVVVQILCKRPIRVTRFTFHGAFVHAKTGKNIGSAIVVFFPIPKNGDTTLTFILDLSLPMYGRNLSRTPYDEVLQQVERFAIQLYEGITLKD